MTAEPEQNSGPISTPEGRGKGVLYTLGGLGVGGLLLYGALADSYLDLAGDTAHVDVAAESRALATGIDPLYGVLTPEEKFRVLFLRLPSVEVTDSGNGLAGMFTDESAIIYPEGSYPLTTTTGEPENHVGVGCLAGGAHDPGQGADIQVQGDQMIVRAQEPGSTPLVFRVGEHIDEMEPDDNTAHILANSGCAAA